MDSKNENQYIKYYSEIEYNYSTFKLDLNLLILKSNITNVNQFMNFLPF